MKKLLILMLVSGSAWARNNSGAEAFVTGFANGFNQARYGGQPYQAPAQVTENVNVYQQAVVTYHYDAVLNESNTRGNYYFFSYQECNRFLQRDRTYNECVRVAN